MSVIPALKLPRFLLWFLAAIALSTGADLSLSAMNGYSLRTDALLLAALDFLFLAPFVLSILACLYLAARLVRVRNFLQCSPWASICFAAWTPIAFTRLWESHDLGSILFQLIVFSAIAILGFVEFRRRRALPHPASLVFASGAALVAIALAIWLPLPGRSMLHEPANEPSTTAAPSSPNLILITLDTTRADHLSLYGYPRPTSPWLDQFAQKATVFDHLVSCSSYTLPTHASLFTGLFPQTHGADVSSDPSAPSLEKLGLLDDKAPVQPLSREAATLAEVARKGGMVTGAISANSAYLSPYFQLDQGFDTYVNVRGDDTRWRPAGLQIGYHFLADKFWRLKRLRLGSERYCLLGSEVNQLAFDWLQPRRDRRFCLFLNYMDAHTPYLPVGKNRELFPLSYARQQVDRNAIMSGERDILDSEKRPLVDAYDAGIRCVDDDLSELFARLEAWKVLDNTLVVILADHGESIGEHHRLNHAVSIYEHEVHVPLIYRLPGQTDGRRIGRVVGTADIMPTILADLHLPCPPGVQGEPLFQEKRKYPVVTELGFYERSYASEAVYDDSWKLIERTNGTRALYNLASDPGETNNLVSTNPEVVQRLEKSLCEFNKVAQPRFKEVANRSGGEIVKNLRSLGYLK